KLKKWLISLGISSALTIYTKNAGYLIIPFIGIYFALRFKFNILKFIKKFWLAIGIFGSIILPLLFINLSNFGRLTHVTAGSLISTGKTIVNRMQPTENILFIFTGNQTLTGFNLIFIAIIIIFITFMIVHLTISRFKMSHETKGHFLLFSWVLSIWGLYTFLHPGTVPRYLLPCLPALYLMVGWVVFEIGKYIKKFSKIKISNWVFIGLIVLIAIPFYSLGNNLNISKSYTYTGFKEAGEWLKDNIEENAIIYSASVRTLRAFSGIEEVENGGNLAGYPEKEDFEDIVKTNKAPVYIEIDVWERIQPEFVYPLTESKINYLQSLGLTFVKVAEGPYPTDKGVINGPVVLILKKE
ncbi:hypothetical protein CL621_02145, partial [archaeon]|nr:hypothetical protein [archaeon]